MVGLVTRRHGYVLALFLVLLTPTAPQWATFAAQGGEAWPDLPPAVCTAPLEPVTLQNPIIITSCTEANLRSALAAGGHIGFDCGPAPVTTPISSPLITSATEDIVLDGGGLVTLDGQGITRIIEKPFTPGSHIDPTLGNDLTLQNIRLVNGRVPATIRVVDDLQRRYLPLLATH